MDFFAEALKDYKKVLEEYFRVTVSESGIRERAERIAARNRKLGALYKSLDWISYYEYISRRIKGGGMERTMAQSINQIKSRLLRDYYKYFSKYAKGKTPEKKVAWVMAFTPVEILEALDISYYYPESYAAVIAANGKEQEFLKESGECSLSGDCCSYSCCIEGCLELEKGPIGVPPRPDILIATNNQCSTLPGWWNILADRYRVPLIVLDYPGESFGWEQAYAYVTKQHRDLITKLEERAEREPAESR